MGNPEKKRGLTSIKEKHKKAKKERKENSPEITCRLKKPEFRQLMDVKSWQRSLFEPPGENVEMYNKKTEHYIKEIEELASRCICPAKV